MGVSVLLHVAAYRFGLTVLYNGGFHYRHGRRMATVVEKTKGNLYWYCLYNQLSGWVDVHNRGKCLD